MLPLLILGLSTLSSAQTQDSVLLAEKIVFWENAVAEKQYARAFECHDQACLLAKKMGLLDKWIDLKTQRGGLIGSIQINQFEAWNYLENTIKELWRKPDTESEYYELCYLYLTQAFVAKQYDEDFVRTKNALENAYQIFHNGLKGKDDYIAVFLYYQLGNAYVRLKEFNSARKIFEEGHAYSIQYDIPKVAKYNDYAGMYISMEDYHQAQKIFQEGISRENMTEEDLLFTKLGYVECLVNLKDFEQALKLNNEVEQVLRKGLKSEDARGKLSEFKIYLEENYALLYEKKCDWTNAIKWYQKTYETAKAYPKSAKRSLGFYSVFIGNLYLKQNNPQQALAYFQRALEIIIIPLRGKGQNPSVDMLRAETGVLRALYGKAKAYQMQGNLDLALSCYELIPIVEAKLRATHFYESSSLLALKESRTRFEEAISIAWQLFERSNGNPQYAERAFRLTELSRGMLLLQSLMQAQQFLPDNIKNKDYDIKVQIAWLEHEIALEKEKGDQRNQEVIARWEQQLFELKLERQKLLEAFPAYAHPDSMVLQVLAAKEVSQWLRKDQALLSYFLADSSAYIFSFDPAGNIRWHKTDLPSDFRTLTRNLIQYMWDGKEAGKDLFLHNASRLYGWLLEKECTRLGSGITSLVLIPDDVLMMLPFEVLLTQAPSPDRPNWRDQPWLIWQYNVSYAFSATLLKAQMEISNEHLIAPSKPAEVFGGFAPVYAQAGEYPLQNTSGMVKTARKMLGGDAWTKESNQEELFKKTANQYRILLLAMHGISNPEQPELSRLLFGDPGPDSLVNNNILYASELQIMQLQADLVVLSACHSGSGKLEVGEGVYSLARAFAAAKVPSTVMSLWLLQENAAPALVEAFFKYLKEGKSKDEALRLAKREFLWNDERFEMTHPFYWAGLVAAGDMRALELDQSYGYIWWALAALTLLLPLVWFGYKKANRRILR